MAHGNNVAYDLSRYERVPVPKKPQLRVVEKAEAPRKNNRKVRFAFMVIVVVMVLAAMIYNQAMLTEMSHRVAEERAKLMELQSENVRLQSQLESKMSIKTLESQAVNDLGMAKIDNYQITYMNMSEGDKVYCAATDNESPGLLEEFFGWFSHFLHISQ